MWCGELEPLSLVSAAAGLPHLPCLSSETGAFTKVQVSQGVDNYTLADLVEESTRFINYYWCN